MMRWIGSNSLTKKRPTFGIYWLLFFLLIFLVSCACSDQSGEKLDSLDVFTGKLDERIISVMEQYEIPGVALAVIKDKELAWSSAYGYADLDQEIEMSIDAICRAESISKSVTAWGVMKLVEQGVINLDDPIEQYLDNWSLPESEYNINEVTIRRLLSNSAGMPLGSLGQEYSPDSEKPTLQQYLSNEAVLSNKPGETFEYSNPGFNLLELLIEEVSGREFNEYMVNEILIPLGMYYSSFEWDEQWSSKVPMGYDLQGNAILPYVYPYKASGGLFSTVEDIARFTIAEMFPAHKLQQTILSKERLKAMRTPQVSISGMYSFVADGYGFGHFIETLQDSTRAVWHGGQGHGWMTHFHIIPETGDGIVIFTNSQRSWPLIAYVLSDWSQWLGYGKVKFSRITSLVVALWVVTGTVFLSAFYRGGKILYEVITDRRRLSMPLHPYSRNRILEFILWVVLSIVLLWSVSQDYLFISSIFPGGASWLGWGIFLMWLMLIFSIILPRYQSTTYPSSTFESS